MKKLLNSFFVVFFCGVLSCCQGAPERRYKVTLRSEGHLKVLLSWDVDYEQERVDFTLEISALTPNETFAVFALGMSDNGDVTNADLMLILYDKEGLVIQDSWTDSYGEILPDRHQDYQLVNYYVTGDCVTIDFWRHFDTHDEQDYRLDNGTTSLFYLMQNTGQSSGASPTDNVFSSVEDLLKELDPALNANDMETDVVPVQLLKPDIPSEYFGDENPQDVLVFNVLQPDVLLPPSETVYWCSVSKLPDTIKSKVHGIGFGVNVTRENRNIVHHMEVFQCDPSDGVISEYSGLCDVKEEPDDVRRCNRVMGAWAKGAEDLFYPKEAGLPLGAEGESRYFRLEVHYNNPSKIEGVVDRSGLTFYYTTKLRPYDVGVLEVGLTYNNNLAIPPRQKDFLLSGYCPRQCTSEAIQPGGINIFASQLHTHFTGRKVWVSHYRSGERLPELNRDDHYDTMFEEIRYIYPSVKILPGDSLVTSCSYDTSSRSYVTTTGNRMQNEMCVSYLHYYPLSALEICKSSTSPSALEEFFLIEKMFTGLPKTLNLTHLEQNYYDMNWDEATTKDLKVTYRDSPVDVECKNHAGKQMPGKWDSIVLV